MGLSPYLGAMEDQVPERKSIAAAAMTLLIVGGAAAAAIASNEDLTTNGVNSRTENQTSQNDKKSDRGKAGDKDKSAYGLCNAFSHGGLSKESDGYQKLA